MGVNRTPPEWLSIEREVLEIQIGRNGPAPVDAGEGRGPIRPIGEGSIITQQIMYSSIGRRAFSVAELAEMLEQFRAFNASESISGMLIYHGGCFAQVIEGPREAVHALYARICRDDRHYAVTTLLDRAVDAREFADWSMAFISEPSAEIRRMAGFRDLFSLPGDEQDAEGVQAGIAHALLLALRDELREMHPGSNAGAGQSRS